MFAVHLTIPGTQNRQINRNSDYPKNETIEAPYQPVPPGYNGSKCPPRFRKESGKVTSHTDLNTNVNPSKQNSHLSRENSQQTTGQRYKLSLRNKETGRRQTERLQHIFPYRCITIIQTVQYELNYLQIKTIVAYLKMLYMNSIVCTTVDVYPLRCCRNWVKECKKEWCEYKCDHLTLSSVGIFAC